MQTHRVVIQGADLTTDLIAHIARELTGTVHISPSFATIDMSQPLSAATLAALRQRYPVDINLLPAGFIPEQVGLLMTDMDSTLINIECIDEIADLMAIKPQIAAITEAAMRGELNFEASLTQRVALLKGLDESALERVYQERLRLNPGAEIMLAGLKKKNIKTALVSGGFTFFTRRLQERLGLDFMLANVLGVEQGKLTGSVVGTIVGAEGKAAFLQQLTAQLGLSPAQTVAMGDGANDLKMMQQAGLSIAYHAKPAVQAQAHTALNHCGLEGVLGLLNLEAA